MADLLSLISLGALVIGYLLGSIMFGPIVTRLAGLGDLRAIGSGNVGATNVLRTGRKSLAALTLVGDALKGTVAVLIGATLGPTAALVAGLGAFLGHTYPVWLHFKGGKGFATYLGVLAGLNWPVAIVCALVWLGVAAISRISSLSALSASLITPIVLFVIGARAPAILFLILTVILWLRHSDNIRRLIDRSESRIGESR